MRQPPSIAKPICRRQAWAGDGFPHEDGMAELGGLLKCLRLFVQRRLQRDRVRFVCVAVLGMCLTFLAISFATADRGRTVFGPLLGADYIEFYSVGTILNQNQPGRLYDLDLQK